MTGAAEIDLLLTHGLVVDGTGSPPFHGHVGVTGERLSVHRGTEVPAARRNIDVTGLAVSPGFIDIHSHSDLDLLLRPDAPAKVTQGVTTEVLGVDGLSYAPFLDRDDQAAFVRQNAGIGGLEPARLPWSSVGEQLEHYTGRAAVNTAAYIGNNALRISHVGWLDAAATGSQLDGMRAELADAMDQGALGLSTGLDYPPGSYADLDELIGLAEVVAQHGGTYHTHVRYGSGDRFVAPFLEAIEIGRRTGCAVHLTHFSKAGRGAETGGAARLLDVVDEANAEGIDVTFDTYPYEWGGTRLARLLPTWIQEGHPDQLFERLSDPQQVVRAAHEVEESPAARAYVMSTPFSDLRLTNLTDEDDRRFEGRYLTEVIAKTGETLGMALCGLVARNPAASFTRPSPHAMTLWKFVCHPAGTIASDGILLGKAHSPRAYGTFARVLGDFVREERLLTLSEAVRKMTSFPASILGLRDRGLLVDGLAADVVVFDPGAVTARAGYETPRAVASGVHHVLVNGSVVLENGRSTGSTPGSGLRRGN